MKVWIICNYDQGTPEDNEPQAAFDSEESAKNYLREIIFEHDDIGFTTRVAHLLEMDYDELMEASGYYYDVFTVEACEVDWNKKREEQDAKMKVEQEKAVKKLKEAEKNAAKKTITRKSALKKLTPQDRKALGV